MARIPQDFIDQVLDRTDIVALIGERVALKRAGAEYAACCPFHEEKTPSFTVAPQKQFYHCFGCGTHGSAISFLMAYDRLEFRDAIEVLANAAGLELPADAAPDPASGPARAPLFDALAEADRFFRRQLRRSQPVIDYLKRRGVSGEAARRFGLGFAPADSRELATRASDAAAAATAGVLIERDAGGYFDRFRNRLMFPIRDARGRTIAFGGRALGDESAKYLNSPETPLFHKSSQMYGLYEALAAQRVPPRLLVVEGYMDVIALAQAGFGNAVATLGTATTEDHLKRLFRHTEEVVFCFDGDSAGQRAAGKALTRCMPVLRGSRRVRFLFLPPGEDPDSWVRADGGAERMQAAIEQARPASAVLLEKLVDGIDLDSAEGRAQLVERAREYLTALPPDAFRDEVLAEIAARARLSIDEIRARLAAPGGGQAQPRSDGESAPGRVHTPLVGRALGLLLNDPSLAAEVGDPRALRRGATRGTGVLADAIEFFAANPSISVSHWLERYRGAALFERLQAIAAGGAPGTPESRSQQFAEAIRRLANGSDSDTLRQRYRELVAIQASAPLDAERAAELNDLFRRLNERSG